MVNARLLVPPLFVAPSLTWLRTIVPPRLVASSIPASPVSGFVDADDRQGLIRHVSVVEHAEDAWAADCRYLPVSDQRPSCSTAPRARRPNDFELSGRAAQIEIEEGAAPGLVIARAGVEGTRVAYL